MPLCGSQMKKAAANTRRLTKPTLDKRGSDRRKIMHQITIPMIEQMQAISMKLSIH
jgi:hypothetical protein